MTFDDFGLNPECNAFQSVTEIIGNGAEWAVKHMPENSVVFVVDEFGGTICFVRGTGKAQLTDTYVNASGDLDYKLIGAWIEECLEEHGFQKVGIIVETSSDVYQVVNNINSRKENETMKNTNLDAVKEFLVTKAAFDCDFGLFSFMDYAWLSSITEDRGIDTDAFEAIQEEHYRFDYQYDYDDVVGAVKEELERFDTFESLYDTVLEGGINPLFINFLIENIGDKLSESDIKHIKRSFEPQTLIN